MITNFEQITVDLSPVEMQLLPLLISGFKKHRADNPIKSDIIVKKTNLFLKEKGIKYTISGVKIRKFANYIRTEGLLPLIATSQGYYTSTDKEEIKKQIKSLMQRANSIKASAEGLNKFLTNN